MSNREFLSVIAALLTVSVYSAWCLWSAAGKRWLRRKPTVLEIPTLFLSNLPTNEEGYYRWARTQCFLLLVLAGVGVVSLIASRILS